MKKLLLLLFFVAYAISSNAQLPYWIWATHSGGGSYEYPNGLWVDTKDSLYLAGRLSGTISFNGGASATGTGADNPFVAKLDSTGKSKWIREINYSGGYDYGWGFCIDKRSNVYSGGTVSSGASMFIMKYDPNGNLLWSITPSGGGVAAMGLITDGADNLYVTGSMQGNVTFGSTTLTYTGSGQNVFLAKLDSNGHFLWAVSSGVANGNSGYDVGRSISIDQYANVYIGGGYGGQMTFGTLPPTALAAGGTSNLFIAEFDSSGNPLNMFTAANAGIDNGDCCTLNHIVLDSCRNIYATGYFENTAQFTPFNLASRGGQDIYVAKADNSGNWQWAVDIGSTGNDQPGGITFDRNSDVYVGGYISNNSAMFGDTLITGGRYFVAKFANSTGARQYVVTAGNNADADGGSVGGVTVDYRKYIYVTFNAGNTVPLTFGPNITLNASSNSDIFLAKLDTIPPRYIIPDILSSYCPGATTGLSFSIVGNFRQGNVFTAQLSDSDGNFTNPINIGTDSSTLGGTIVVTIPDTVKTGNTYLIRIISSNPATSSYVNGCHAYYQKNVYTDTSYITIGGGGVINPIISPVDTAICPGASVMLAASGGTTYTWSNGDTSSVITVSPIKDSLFTVTAKNGCGIGSVSDSVLIQSAPPLLILPQPPPSFCSGSNAELKVSGGGTNFIWTPVTGLSDTTSGDSVLAGPTLTTTYTVTGKDSLGCESSGTEKVTVFPAPIIPTFTQNVDTLKSSAQYQNQWYLNGTLLVGDTSQYLTITTAGEYWVSVTNEANGCSSASDSASITTGINQLSAISDQLSIYPNPFNNNIVIKINSSVADIKDWNLQIIDVLGRTIYSQSSLNYSNDIDVSNLAGGVYFITVINKTGRTVVPVVKE